MRNTSRLLAATLFLVWAAAQQPAAPQKPAEAKPAEAKPPAETKPAAETKPPAEAKPTAESKPAEEAPAEPPAPKTYVGSDTCQACHEDIFNAFEKDRHHAVGRDKKRGWENNACESCHGPASTHVETVSADEIVNPAKLSAARVDELCLTCHRNQPTHIGRIQSSHARSRIACTSCHRMHQPEPESLVARKTGTINKQCAGCHQNAWASFQRPHAHRLPQGAMSCVDCHNPHGSFLMKQVRTFASNEPGCFKCHANMRGPFTFEHAPVRLEGCASCHEPHGSANPKMLNRAEVRFLCLECHSNMPQQTTGPASVIGVVPPSFHDLRSPRFQNCTVCHQKVHGSHVDRHLTR